MSPDVPETDSNDRMAKLKHLLARSHCAVSLGGGRFERKNCRGRPRHPKDASGSESGYMGMGARGVCSHRHTSLNPLLDCASWDQRGANAEVLLGAFSW